MDELESIALLLFGGLSFRFALTLTGQNWAKTYQQTVAFLVLPFITYVITKTISGNIALSLGMIGAMSIVRCRNPVKSPLELIMFFALITLGMFLWVGVQSQVNSHATTAIYRLSASMSSLGYLHLPDL